jgi:O-antigen ligase
MQIFILFALALFALLAYQRYSFAVILLTGLLPTYLLRLTVFNIPTNFLELAIVITATTGFLQTSTRKTWRQTWRQVPSIFIILTFLFVFACLISTVVSPHLHTSLGILKGWIIIPILLGWLVITIAHQKPTSKIINALLISGTVMAIIALFQLGTLERVKGIYDVPNSLALFLTPLLILATWHIKKIPYLLSFIIIAAAIIATQSVAAIIVIIITTMIAAGGAAGRRKFLLLILIFLLISVGYFTYTGRLTHLHNSVAVRLQLWSVSWDLIKQHPLVGVGLGTFEPAYQHQLHQRFALAETDPLPEFVFRDSHNWPLSFWLNTGLLGLLSFIGLHLYIFRQKKSTHYSLLTTTLLSLLIYGLVDTIYWKNDLATLHWLLLSLLLSSIQVRTNNTQNSESQ